MRLRSPDGWEIELPGSSVPSPGLPETSVMIPAPIHVWLVVEPIDIIDASKPIEVMRSISAVVVTIKQRPRTVTNSVSDLTLSARETSTMRSKERNVVSQNWASGNEHRYKRPVKVINVIAEPVIKGFAKVE